MNYNNSIYSKNLENYDKKALLYYRVSTKMQEEKYSLNAQRTELKRYAKQKNWFIVAEHQDVESGGKLEKTGLNALLDDVEDGKADVVLVIDQDRLSRLDNSDWNTLKTILRQHNVDIASPGSYTNLKDEDNVFVADLMNLLAQREKSKIVRRMMRGKEQRTREGKGWGAVPTGYKLRRSGEYEIDPAWSWVIEFIDTKYLEGMSAKKIAAELNKIGKTPNGNNWSTTTVLDKLKSEAYTGKFERHFSHSGSSVVIDDAYPVLRTPARHAKILKRLAANSKRKPREYNTEFSDITFVCEKCGKSLSVNKNSNAYGVHYVLIHSAKTLPDGSLTRECKTSVNVARFEKNIRNSLKKVLSGPSFASEYIDLDNNASELESLSSELKTINKLLQDFGDQRKNVIALVRKGLIEMDEAEDELKLAESEKTRLQERERGLRGKYELLKQGQFTYDVVRQYLTILDRYEVLLGLEEQRELISDVFPTASISEDCKNITLHGALPNGAPLDVKVAIDGPLQDARLKSIHARQEKDYERIVRFWERHEDIYQIPQLAKLTGIPRSVINDYRKRFYELPDFPKRSKNGSQKAKLLIVRNIIDYKLANPKATYKTMQTELEESESRIKKAMRYMKDEKLMQLYKSL